MKTDQPRKKYRLLAYSCGGGILLLSWIILPFIFGDGIVPFPWTVVVRLSRLMVQGDIWIHMGMTLLRTLAGFGLALVLGAAAGIAAGRLFFVSRTLFLPVSVIQGAPPLLWIIPLVLILGSDGLAPVGVVFFVVLPVVIISVREGMKRLDPGGLEMMKIYAPSRLAAVRGLYLPALTGHLKSLLLTGVLIGLKSSIIGEWFGARSGIGRMINEYFYNFDMPSFYAVALFYVMFVVFVAWLAGRIGSRVFTRRRSRIPPAAEMSGELISARARSSRLEMKDVSFAFGSRQVCDRLSFSHGRGRTVVLTGDSGSGKTTLARLAVGLLKPHSGVVTVPGRACLIFQDDVFLNHRDCYGNVIMAVDGEARDHNRAAGRALAALDAAGLEDCIRRFPDELSGGMKKRLSFARALAFDPDFIILDEPFNKLHKKARLALWDLYFTLFTRRGVPSLIITHYPEELDARRGLSFFVMNNGRVVERKR